MQNPKHHIAQVTRSQAPVCGKGSDTYKGLETELSQELQNREGGSTPRGGGGREETDKQAG
jgi:hypothetical protein